MLPGRRQGRQWQAGRDPEARARSRPGGELAMEQLDPLAHPGDPEARARCGAALTLVRNLDQQLLIALVDAYPAAPGTGVPDHVGQGLLDDPERRHIDVGWQWPALAVPLDFHADAGSGGRLRELVKVGEARGRLERGPVAGQFAGHIPAPQRYQHSPQARQGLPAGGLDGRQRLAGLFRLRRPASRTRLNGDDADAVRDHVVQFAGDAQSLGGHRPGLALGVQRLGMAPGLQDRVADEPGDGDGERDGELGGEIDYLAGRNPDPGGRAADENAARGQRGQDRHPARPAGRDKANGDAGQQHQHYRLRRQDLRGRVQYRDPP